MVPDDQGDVRQPPMQLNIDRLAAAAESLALFLIRHDPTCTALDIGTVRRKYHSQSAIAAWKIRIAPGEDERRVDVIIDPDYPFSRPEIGIADFSAAERPRARAFVNQTLCFEDPSDPLPIALDNSMITEILMRVKAQLALEDPQDVAEARRLEFASYWANGEVETPPLLSLVQDRGPSRQIAWAVSHGRIYAAETAEYLNEWLERAGRGRPKKINESVLLDFEAIPRIWPSTNRELLAATALDGQTENVRLLRSVAVSMEVPIPVILRVPTPEGNAFATVWCDDPKRPVGKGKSVSTKWHGFSPGHGPAAEIAKRFFEGNGETRRGRVDRADPMWLFSRAGNAFAPALLESDVVIIGAGALGSAIARRLAKAGIGHLVIIDPDILTWDNVARHELGGIHVGKSKAKALAQMLRQDFPHLDVTGLHDRWEDVWRASPDVIRNATLIVSTVADTGSELHLNKIARTDDLARVLFGWLEDRAAAGHALLVGGLGGCLGCGLRPNGEFIERAVTHAQPTLRRVPGCDAFYQPYSALEAESVILMIVETAIDAILSNNSRSRLLTWIASAKMMAETGATVRDEWKAKNGDPGAGRVRVEHEWKRSVECPLCSDNA